MQLVEIFSFDLALSAALLIIGIFLFRFKRTRFVGVGDNAPPQPRGAWPILGHIPLIVSYSNVQLARIFADLADKYGPIFTIKLGMTNAIVISSHEAVKECFTINDKVLADRPPSSAGEYLGFNYAIFGFTTYGPYWRDVRRVVVVELLSSKRIEAFKHLRASELETSIKELCCFLKIKNGEESKVPVKVDLSKWIEQLSMNIIVKSISGKRYVNSFDGVDEDEEAKCFRRVVRVFMYESGQLVPSDLIPSSLLKWADFGGHIRKMKAVAQEMNSILQTWIDEHVQSRRDNPKADDGRDFIDVLLSKIDDSFTFTTHNKETIIKATVLTLIVAGADTTSIQLTWAISLLMNNPHVMKRAQEEIDFHIGRDRWAEESDIENLTYLQAILKETLRLYPPAPLSVPHQASEDCTVCGYVIPKGSTLFVDIRKLHRDPRVWSNPEEFNPERFLGETGIEDNNFEYAPFGYGRRSCPGSSYALQVMHLTIARLLQGFDFSTPDGLPVDMTEGLGITMPRTSPLEVCIMPRLHDLLSC